MPPRKINAEKEVLGYRRGKKKKLLSETVSDPKSTKITGF